MPPPKYDVFVSYSRRNSDAVKTVAQALRARDLSVWFDEWVLPPGEPWLDHLEEGLRSSGAVAVFVGGGGLGAWERNEMRVAVDQQVRARGKVIPVLLPGIERPEGDRTMGDVLGSSFLATLNAVEFSAGLDDKAALDKLYWGITGRNPLEMLVAKAAPAAAAGPAPDAIAAMVARVAAEIMARDTTFLVGRGAIDARTAQPPAPCEVSARLLRQLEIVEEGYAGLVPGIESAAALLEAFRGETQLESAIREMFEGAGDPQPGVHAGLAALLKVLGQRPKERRPRPREPRLVITTNFDLFMERALLRAGIPFSRLVQFRGQPRIDVTEFKAVDRLEGGRVLIDGERVDTSDVAALDAAIYRPVPVTYTLDTAQSGSNGLAGLAVNQLVEPILYKFHGSHDIDGSCAISADQCFDFAWRLLKQECVPSQISRIISTSTLVALGSSVLDHDFRLTYHTLLRHALDSNGSPRFAIASREEVDRRDPNLQLTAREWRAIEETALRKYGIKCIDAPVADFLAQLAARLRAAWGAGA